MTMIKVGMVPYSFSTGEGGIRRVVEAYKKYLPDHGYRVVDPRDGGYDFLASHAGATPDTDVAHNHGLYWTEDYEASSAEWEMNARVIDNIRSAKVVTVPSPWVAETFQRDMHLSPYIVPHGIEWQEWEPHRTDDVYVLWNKNRAGVDVCDPSIVHHLANKFPTIHFVSTFAANAQILNNMTITGLVSHAEMKGMVQSASVYLSTTKETFGIGVLEAMAAGVPILGWNYGGNKQLVQHGVNGFLAAPGDFDGLVEGLLYCLKYHHTLADNGREMAKQWSWQNAMLALTAAYRAAERIGNKPSSVSVIIPTYNYGTEEELGRAIRSALDQTYKPEKIIVVDDGSDDNGATEAIAKKYAEIDPSVVYIRQNNSGVAIARNTGIFQTDSKYICCLDADDAIEPEFLNVCIGELERDKTLGITYTGISAIAPDGSRGLITWPGEFDYSAQMKLRNQIPTCCVFRRVIWERLGGYRQRYAPNGAGAEDAEFWLRAGAAGFNAKKVTGNGLFVYRFGTGRVSGDPEYMEVDWAMWHPWTKDLRHPFASIAKSKNRSHAVRQYDEPVISVIIPMGKAHQSEVINALDSLEAQTFRKWEAILVCDGAQPVLPNDHDPAHFFDAYPYVRADYLLEPHGAGYARNWGAKMARAPLLLFLDADDWLYPQALNMLYAEWRNSSSITYSDYVGKAIIADVDQLNQLHQAKRLLYYNNKKQEAVISHKSLDYDYDRAVSQPNPQDMYIWNLITSLVPKEWHDEIGGFDEDMPSWEDWDYWIRMAMAGKPFMRVPEHLVVYRFATGTRRETGLDKYKDLVQYMQDKYKGVEIMPCSGCGKSRIKTVAPAQQVVTPRSASQPGSPGASDSDFFLVQYEHPNRGQHRVVGYATKTFYGYVGKGARFYAHRADIAAQPDIFVRIADTEKAPTAQKTQQPEPPTPLVEDRTPKRTRSPKHTATQVEAQEDPKQTQPVDLDDEKRYNLQNVPGITSGIAMQLNAAGIHSLEELNELELEKLEALKGVGPARASIIKEFVAQQLQDTKDDGE